MRQVFPPNVTDSVPEEQELRMLVATEVSDYYTLGTMLNLKMRHVDMFKEEHKGNVIMINMRILTKWIEAETRKPTTWQTLIAALRDIPLPKLADDILRKLQRTQE